MLTALYYPHVKMSTDLLKNALFLWDKIEYIAPNLHFEPDYHEPELAQAVSLFAGKYIPTDKEKQMVNDSIVDLLSQPLPEWFFVKVEDLHKDLRYTLYPEKLAPDTWRRLEKEGLANSINSKGFETSQQLGLTIMSILANCCAGTQKRLVTDQVSSYSALDRYLVTIGGGELGDFGKKSENSETLVTISLHLMNFKNVSLSRLIELRQKENTTNGAHIRVLRLNYLRKIEEYVNKLSQIKTPQDAEEIRRIFEREMKDDFNLLKDELKDEAQKVVFSSEMATAAISLVGSFLLPIISPTVLLAGGALYKRKVDYNTNRNKILREHPMSWLYSMNKIQAI
ncbi:hypothetical protein Cri9333_0784 [Crinalium epipsammum PCC 9333]|uniref:Uncharacterized protein n=1 Tax=Crinalium epipsammum PCC 9333 TaxID=1173022 RepID=K9VUB6_9CYAN|nr:hypothetical protein [Crinalium epipsammum]AFZ11703.1 hypothetical protein Cri9333_0784 [Crinalium epipsammum PCC 9333]